MERVIYFGLLIFSKIRNQVPWLKEVPRCNFSNIKYILQVDEFSALRPLFKCINFTKNAFFDTLDPKVQFLKTQSLKSDKNSICQPFFFKIAKNQLSWNFNDFFSPLAPKLIEITFLKEIQTLIVEYIIDHFLLTRCQKKYHEQGYDIKGFQGTAASKKLGYFSVMKYFGFIDMNRTVDITVCFESEILHIVLTCELI